MCHVNTKDMTAARKCVICHVDISYDMAGVKGCVICPLPYLLATVATSTPCECRFYEVFFDSVACWLVMW